MGIIESSATWLLQTNPQSSSYSNVQYEILLLLFPITIIAHLFYHDTIIIKIYS